MATLFRNNVAATLGASVGPSDGALLLTGGQGALFPALSAGADYFYVTVVHITTGAIEIMRVNSRVGDTLNVTRGQDGTSGIAFTNGSFVEMRLTAQMLRELDWRNYINVGSGIAGLLPSGLLPDGNLSTNIARVSYVDAQIATRQPVLGFTPVQQGTGIGQVSNIVKIGWSGSKTKITIDSTDMGNIAMEPWVVAYINGLANVPGGFPTLDGAAQVPAARVAPLAYVPLAGGTMTGQLTVTGAGVSAAGTVSGGEIVSSQNFRSATANAVFGTSTAGMVYLRPNGVGMATGEATLNSSGVFAAPNVIATSDARRKHDIVSRAIDTQLPDQIELYDWLWDGSNTRGTGVIAQHLQRYAPQYVYESDDGILGVDKAGLALEGVAALASRVRALEAKYA